MAANNIQYSEKYYDDVYEYRWGLEGGLQRANGPHAMRTGEHPLGPSPPPQARRAAAGDCAAAAQGPPPVRGAPARLDGKKRAVDRLPACADQKAPLRALPQAEWRGLGVQQSRGWVHYAIHRPEPHIMLYR